MGVNDNNILKSGSFEFALQIITFNFQLLTLN